MSDLRLLVLEDHAFQRSVLVKALNYLGYADVRHAAEGSEALALLMSSGVVDVVICDLRMEGMDGLEFLRIVGEMGLAHSVIISSELADDLRRPVEHMSSVLGLNVLGDIGKPFTLDVLREVLQCCSGRINRLSCASRMELPTEEKVREGLARKEFRAYFQPKFNLQTGDVAGVDVLVRWLRPGKKMLLPADFVPVIERCGLLNEMFFGLLEQGLSLQRVLKHYGKSVDLAFNLCISQLAHPELTAHIRRMLQVHRQLATKLMFEVRDTGLLDAPAASLESLIRLRMMGCGLSIGEFGVGFSSLQRLCQLPFTEIKLDAGFIRNMLHHPRFHAVIDSTLVLAESLNMKVVAEGIETIEQQCHLAEMGCLFGQGSLYARPLSWAELVCWFLENGESAHGWASTPSVSPQGIG